MDHLLKNFALIVSFWLVLFLFLPAGVLSLTLFGTFQSFLLILLVVTLFIAVSLCFIVCTIMVYFIFVQYLILWLNMPQLCHNPLNWRTYSTFYSSFSYFWLYCAFIISYLTDNLSWIIWFSTGYFFHLIHIKGFQQCSCTLQVGLEYVSHHFHIINNITQFL